MVAVIKLSAPESRVNDVSISSLLYIASSLSSPLSLCFSSNVIHPFHTPAYFVCSVPKSSHNNSSVITSTNSSTMAPAAITPPAVVAKNPLAESTNKKRKIVCFSGKLLEKPFISQSKTNARALFCSRFRRHHFHARYGPCSLR